MSTHVSTTEQIDPAAVETLLSGLPTRDWLTISGAFRSAPETGVEGDPATWALLADVMSMALVPANAAEPFGPVWSDREGRSLVPSDLSESQMALLSSLLDGLTSAELVVTRG